MWAQMEALAGKKECKQPVFILSWFWVAVVTGRVSRKGSRGNAESQRFDWRETPLYVAS